MARTNVSGKRAVGAASLRQPSFQASCFDPLTPRVLETVLKCPALMVARNVAESPVIGINPIRTSGMPQRTGCLCASRAASHPQLKTG